MLKHENIKALLQVIYCAYGATELNIITQLVRAMNQDAHMPTKVNAAMRLAEMRGMYQPSVDVTVKNEMGIERLTEEQKNTIYHILNGTIEINGRTVEGTEDTDNSGSVPE